MNNVKRSIGWADYTINPVKGLCPVGCSYCYARRMYKRFKWNPYIKFDNQPLLGVRRIKKPSRIFVGSTIELFGEWVEDWMLDNIFVTTQSYPQHTFIFLTKHPLHAMKFMGWRPDYQHHARPARKLPNNVWMGVSITNHLDAPRVRNFLLERMAKVNFISIEPLLGHMDGWSLQNVIELADWVIIGQQTPVRKATMPKIEWIKEIVKAADEVGIPVFLKDNLEPLIVQEHDGQKYAPLWANGGYGTLRQEFPSGLL